MTVIVVSRVTPGLRGTLTRWFLEIDSGVFVGTVSARIRERLWTLVQNRRRLGACSLISRAPNEQGFIIQTNGDSNYRIVDYDGLQLVARRSRTSGPQGPKAPVKPTGEASGGNSPAREPVEGGTSVGDD